MTTPLPSAHEPLPADFLRKYGAQKGMRYRQKGNAEDAWDLWPDWGDKFPAETCYNLYDFCAPAGTIAAATTPLPEPGCDCGKPKFPYHTGACAIHRSYVHILPAALAALPEKPEGLICCRSLEKLPSAKWGDFVYWPIVPDGETPNGFPFADFAYAVPAQSGQGQGKEYRVTCPHCLGQQKAKGAVCLECNGIGYWMNPYPLSTQPEGGDGECMVPVTGYSPPSTAAETPRDGSWMDKWGACKVCNGEIPHGHMPNCDIFKLEQKITDLERQLAEAEAWKDEISAAIQRSGLGIMRTSQGPAGTMICTRPEVKDAEDRMVLELINENIDLESRLTAATAERDEARKRLETIQTT